MPLTKLFKPPTNTTITSNAFTNSTTVQVAGTYVAPAGCAYIRVRMAGSGGGGGGGGGGAGSSLQGGSGGGSG